MLLLVLCTGDRGALPLAGLLACASAGERGSALVPTPPGTASAGALPLAAMCAAAAAGSALLLPCAAEAAASCPPPAWAGKAWALAGAAFGALPFPFLPLRAALLLRAAGAEGLCPGFLSLPPCSSQHQHTSSMGHAKAKLVGDVNTEPLPVPPCTLSIVVISVYAVLPVSEGMRAAYM